jgi:glycosyltransferase involved in cell wall biosynthesis
LDLKRRLRICSWMTETMSPLKVLCLDIEGGHGGSSRSLHQALQAVDRTLVAPSVICRRGGWIEDAYADLDIPCRVAPAMPRMTALDRESRNAVDLLRFWFSSWPRAKDFRRQLLAAVDTVELVHCNHISLTPLAIWLRRKRPNLRITLHIRTRPYLTRYGAYQARSAARTFDGFVFITENERDYFIAQSGGVYGGAEPHDPPGPVIYNSVASADAKIEPLPEIPVNDRLRAVCLSNFDLTRGVDRLVDVAAAVPEDARGAILFIVAGDVALNGNLPGLLGKVRAEGGTLADYARARGVADQFCFLGYVSEPERVLAAGHVLLKPTRRDDPWGRDILEAMSAGLPVASVGRYDRFVETGQTGLLQPHFDAGELANWLAGLVTDRSAVKDLGRNAAERAQRLCDPTARAGDLASFWREVAEQAPPAE